MFFENVIMKKYISPEQSDTIFVISRENWSKGHVLV